MARVLWLGDAGCTTGFATVTHALGDRLVANYGHDIHVLATNYQGDHWPTNLKLYVPTMRDPRDIYGKGRFIEMLGKVMPDVVVSLNDPLVLLHHLLRNTRDPDRLLARFAPILAYLPIDGTDYPEVITKLPGIIARQPPIEDRPSPGFVPVVMAKHGNTVFPDAPLVYHGIDSELFRPPSVRPIAMSNGTVVTSRTDAKRALGLPTDSILIIRVDRNSERKNYADTYRALVPVMRRNPNVHVWFHCKDEDRGVDLSQLVSKDLALAPRFHWPGQYDTRYGWVAEDLVAVYAAGDIFVSTSTGEGFGLTLGEAAACGLPIVAQNVSAIPEVVGPGGILLEPERPIAAPSGQDNWLPNVASFSDALERLVTSKGARRDLGKAARAHVLANFSWDDAAARFDELIRGVAEKTSRSASPGGTDDPAPQ